MHVNDTFHSDGFSNDFSQPNLEVLAKLKELDKHIERLGGLGDIKGIQGLNIAKTGSLFKQSTDKFFYHFENGKAVCKDLKTLIIDHPKKSISDAFQDIQEKIKDNKIFFGQRIKNKKTSQFQYIIQEEHQNNFANQNVVHKNFNSKTNTVQTTTSESGNHTVHTMSMAQYAKMTNLVLSKMETISATILNHQNKTKEQSSGEVSLMGRATVLKQDLAKGSIKNLMEKSFEAQRRGKESVREEEAEQEKYNEIENTRQRRRAEKDAKYEKMMENFELQEESKAIKKGESPPTGRSFKTNP